MLYLLKIQKFSCFNSLSLLKFSKVVGVTSVQIRTRQLEVVIVIQYQPTITN